jgi:hypothetical protein
MKKIIRNEIFIKYKSYYFIFILKYFIIQFIFVHIRIIENLMRIIIKNIKIQIISTKF